MRELQVRAPDRRTDPDVDGLDDLLEAYTRAVAGGLVLSACHVVSYSSGLAPRTRDRQQCGPHRN